MYIQTHGSCPQPSEQVQTQADILSYPLTKRPYYPDKNLPHLYDTIPPEDLQIIGLTNLIAVQDIPVIEFTNGNVIDNPLYVKRDPINKEADRFRASLIRNTSVETWDEDSIVGRHILFSYWYEELHRFDLSGQWKEVGRLTLLNDRISLDILPGRLNELGSYWFKPILAMYWYIKPYFEFEDDCANGLYQRDWVESILRNVLITNGKFLGSDESPFDRIKLHDLRLPIEWLNKGTGGAYIDYVEAALRRYAESGDADVFKEEMSPYGDFGITWQEIEYADPETHELKIKYVPINRDPSKQLFAPVPTTDHIYRHPVNDLNGTRVKEIKQVLEAYELRRPAIDKALRAAEARQKRLKEAELKSLKAREVVYTNGMIAKVVAAEAALQAKVDQAIKEEEREVNV
jgi:hypothetical protein